MSYLEMFPAILLTLMHDLVARAIGFYRSNDHLVAISPLRLVVAFLVENVPSKFQFLAGLR